MCLFVCLFVCLSTYFKNVDKYGNKRVGIQISNKQTNR